MNKILVGCPTSDRKEYCFEEYLESVKTLSYSNYDILIVDNSETDEYYEKIKKYLPVLKSKFYENARDSIVESRNILREYALEKGYDYFLSLEQDVIPPRDIIETLLKSNKKVISGLYFYVVDDKLIPMAWGKHDEKHARRLEVKDVEKNKVMEVVTAGLGCCLIHIDILEKIKFRYVKEKKPFDDIWFCEDVRKINEQIYLDTSVKCKHLIKNWSWDNIKK